MDVPSTAVPPALMGMHRTLTDICLLMRRKLRDQFEREKLSFNQYRILGVLKGRPDLSLSSLDEKLTMKKGNLSRMVDGMVRQNLINRERDTSSDRRKISLSLTPKGEKALEVLDRKQGDLVRTLYQSVPEGEIGQFHETLARLLHHLQGLRYQHE